MAENLEKYTSGRAFLQQLRQHGLPKDAVQQLTDTIAQIVEEAQAAALQQQQHPSGAKAGAAAAQQQQQQQAVQQVPIAVRDLQQAETVLPGLPLLIPRGKFDAGFFPDCLQLSNKQTSVLVPYSSIQHVLVIDAIPKQPNTTNVVLVMKEGCSVTQGKNQLDLISIQTKDTPELSIPAPAACSHFGDELVGAVPIVLSQLLASFLPDVGDDTFLTADSGVFSSSAGDLMIAANRGAAPGWLLPLSVGLCYIGKPGRFLAACSIRKVVFHRAGGGSATFDVTFRFNAAAAAAAGSSNGSSSSSSSKSLELGQIDAAELMRLQEYFASHGIRMGTDDDDDDDDEDEGAAAGPGSKGAAATVAAGAEDEFDDEEDDDDYDPEAAEEPPNKRQRSGSAAAAAADPGKAAASGDEEEAEDEESGSGDEGSEEDEDSEDVSLVDEDAMDDDDEDDES